MKISKIFGLVAILALLLPVFSSAVDYDPVISMTVEKNPDYAVFTVIANDRGTNSDLKELRLLEDGQLYNSPVGPALWSCLGGSNSAGESSCKATWYVVSDGTRSTHTYKAQVKDSHDVWFDSEVVTIEYFGINTAPVWNSNVLTSFDIHEPEVGATPSFAELLDLSNSVTDDFVTQGLVKKEDLSFSVVGLSHQNFLECKIESQKLFCKPVLYNVGAVSLTVRASDGSKSSDKTFTVNVLRKDHPPLLLSTTASAISMSSNGVNTDVDLFALFKEPYGSTLKYSLEFDPVETRDAFQDLGSSNFVSKSVRVGDKYENHDFLKLVGTNKRVGTVNVKITAKSDLTGKTVGPITVAVTLTAVKKSPTLKSGVKTAIDLESNSQFSFSVSDLYDLSAGATISSYSFVPSNLNDNYVSVVFDASTGFATLTTKSLTGTASSWGVSVTDSDGMSSVSTPFTIRVSPFNNVPVLNFTKLQEKAVLTRNTALTIDLKPEYSLYVFDSGEPNSQSTNVWSCASERSDLEVSVDNTAKTLKLNSSSNFVGSVMVTCTVKDRDLFGNLAKSATASFSVTVARENVAPTIHNLLNVKSYVNRLFSMQVVATDFDKEDSLLSYKLVDTPVFTLGAQTGILSNYTPATIGEQKVVNLKVCDTSTASNKCTTATFTITAVSEGTSTFKNVKFNDGQQSDGTSSTFTNIIESLVEDSNLKNFWNVIKSTVKSSTVDNSFIVESSTVLNSTVRNSYIEGCTVENSTLIDFKGRMSATNGACNIKNSFVDPTTMVDSTIEDSTVLNSFLTYTDVKKSTVNNAVVVGTQGARALIEDNTLKSGKLRKSDGTFYEVGISGGPKLLSELVSALVARASADRTSVNIGDTVNFDASTSTDAVSYSWNIDGSVKTGVRVSHSFNTAGSKTVTLTVTDRFGVSNTVSLTVIVSTPSTSGGSSGGGGGGGSSGGGSSGGSVVTGPPVYSVTVSLDGTTVQVMSVKSSARFSYNGAQHKVTLDSIAGELVTVTVESSPQTKIIAVGENALFDLDDNGQEDFVVTVQSVSGTAVAQLSFRLVREGPIVSQDPPAWVSTFTTVNLKSGESGVLRLKDYVTLPTGVTVTKIVGNLKSGSDVVSIVLDESTGIATLTASNSNVGSALWEITVTGSNGKSSTQNIAIVVSRESKGFFDWITGWFSTDIEAPTTLVGLVVAQTIALLILVAYLVFRKYGRDDY
ncbi:PKD domain-containing protein [Candidatus Woesearchaeota archaeon]|nr:PKD domain-containing protein [Candidatus Woesearchaeota archaeon]